MSDETKKPFAFMAPDPTMTGNEWEALYVAGIRLANHRPAYGGALPEICDDINAAVAAREAKLRGAVLAMITAAGPTQHATGCTAMREARNLACSCHLRNLMHAIATARDALDGTGPDYVPRAELDAANAKLKAYGAAVDLLDKHESLTRAEVCAWLEYAGLKKPPKPEATPVAVRTGGVVHLTGFSDSVLLDEIRRRGYTEPGIARPLAPRQRECSDHSDGHHYVGGTCSCGAPWRGRDLVVGTG